MDKVYFYANFLIGTIVGASILLASQIFLRQMKDRKWVGTNAR